MPPKDSKTLREQLERANETESPTGDDYTAEGKKVPRPKRREFLANLEKVSKPKAEHLP